eukprot:249451_1
MAADNFVKKEVAAMFVFQRKYDLELTKFAADHPITSSSAVGYFVAEADFKANTVTPTYIQKAYFMDNVVLAGQKLDELIEAARINALKTKIPADIKEYLKKLPGQAGFRVSQFKKDQARLFQHQLSYDYSDAKQKVEELFVKYQAELDAEILNLATGEVTKSIKLKKTDVDVIANKIKADLTLDVSWLPALKTTIQGLFTTIPEDMKASNTVKKKRNEEKTSGDDQEKLKAKMEGITEIVGGEYRCLVLEVQVAVCCTAFSKGFSIGWLFTRRIAGLGKGCCWIYDRSDAGESESRSSESR